MRLKLNKIRTRRVDKLSVAFRSLRKQGLIARQGFSCCRSCAGHEISNELGKKMIAGEDLSKFKGVVFFCRQSLPQKREGEPLYLSYGDVDYYETKDKEHTFGLPTVEVGKMVTTALTEAGCEVEWDGNPDRSIVVKEYK